MRLWYFWARPVANAVPGLVYFQAKGHAASNREAHIDCRLWVGPLRSVTIIKDSPKPKQPSRAKRTRRGSK